MTSLWNPDNVRDTAESIGLSHLSKEVVENLARDVDYRIAQILENSFKFMRHAKRTTMHTDDVSQALRVLDIEPLFGYDATRPLRFGEASIGPNQTIFYVDDEEVDFEKLINAPLPRVPREVAFTAHWLAVEGVQPSIAQNPSSSDARHQELMPKGPSANAGLAAVAGQDSAAVKPQVRHILSSEIQLYFERITTAILLEDKNDEARNAAFNSVRTDPGLHQLVPYFVQFIAEKVTHQSKDLFVLTQILHLARNLLQNETLFIEAYISPLIPSILTCLTGKNIGSPSDPLNSVMEVRDVAASLIVDISRKHSKSSTTLKPRLARTLLKTFLNPSRSFGAHYGALISLRGIIGVDGVKAIVLPNLQAYDSLLQEGLADETKRPEAEMVVLALLRLIDLCAQDMLPRPIEAAVNGQNGRTNGDAVSEEVRQDLVERVGDIIGNKVAISGNPAMIALVGQIQVAAPS
jgi:transcription initiation factor TFIID subunit 6